MLAKMRKIATVLSSILFMNPEQMRFCEREERRSDICYHLKRAMTTAEFTQTENLIRSFHHDYNDDDIIEIIDSMYEWLDLRRKQFSNGIEFEIS